MSHRRLKGTVLGVAMCLLAPQYVAGQWLGRQVTSRIEARFFVGDKEVDSELIPQNLTVEAVDGELLWVGRAWVHKDHVLPIEEAVEYYTQYIQADPESAWAYGRRGSVWDDQGEYDKAIQDYDAAIRLDPNEPSYVGCRGVAWFNKKQYDKALADYNEAIRLDPKEPMAYVCRAGLWYETDDLDKAIADYDQAIRLDPLAADAYVGRGSAWYCKNELDRALADYSKALELDPHSTDAYFNRAGAWHSKGELDQAIADYGEALKLNRNSTDTYIYRASAWYAQGEFSKAISDCSEVIRLDPASMLSFNLRAWIQATCPDAELRNGKQAVADATCACKLSNWQEPRAIDTLAAACAEAGDFESAIKWQQKAIELFQDAEDKADSESRLALYRAGKPYHEERPRP